MLCLEAEVPDESKYRKNGTWMATNVLLLAILTNIGRHDLKREENNKNREKKVPKWRCGFSIVMINMD